MSWRIDNNERSYNNATLIAWEIVLPERHLPILDSDRIGVRKTRDKLKVIFTLEELKEAGSRVRRRLKL